MKPSTSEHRCRGLISGVDRVAEPRIRKTGQQMVRTFFDPFQQRGTEASPSLRGMHDPPRSDDARLLAHDLSVGDDRIGAVHDDPSVGGEVEVRAVPPGQQEVRVQHDLTGVVEVVGDQHRGYRIEVAPGRRPELVSVGEVHAGQASAPSLTGAGVSSSHESSVRTPGQFGTACGGRSGESRGSRWLERSSTVRATKRSRNSGPTAP